MLRRFSITFTIFSILLDILLVDAALFTAVQLRAPLSAALDFIKPIPKVDLPWMLYLLFPILWVGLLFYSSVYDGRKNFRIVDELSSLTFGSLLAAVSLAGILYFTYRDMSRFMFVMAAGLAFLFLTGWRVVARLAFRSSGLPVQVRRVLILGAGDAARKLAKQITDMPPLGLHLVGFLDDDWQCQADHADVHGSLDAARRTIADKMVDDVVIALPHCEHQRLSEVVSTLHDLPVRVWIIPDYFSLTLHSADSEKFAGIPMLDLRAPALSEHQRLTKRAFDLALSILLLPFALALMGIIALAIRLDSPGPIFYRSRRIGENGRIFHMIKFRTSVDNAEQVSWKEENGSPIDKRRDDPRVTRVGRLLRRAGLDEFPQLFNVLRGEMSLVGPRPEMPEPVEKYDLWQRRRFSVPQGVTGWRQVNGRSDKPMHLHAEEDLYYVQNYSLWLDLHILIHTLWAVVRGKGAY